MRKPLNRGVRRQSARNNAAAGLRRFRSNCNYLWSESGRHLHNPSQTKASSKVKSLPIMIYLSHYRTIHLLLFLPCRGLYSLILPFLSLSNFGVSTGVLRRLRLYIVYLMKPSFVSRSKFYFLSFYRLLSSSVAPFFSDIAIKFSPSRHIWKMQDTPSAIYEIFRKGKRRR